MKPVTVIILTYNEGVHIERAIRSVRDFVHSVYVVDSGSKDDTVALAKGAGAHVLYNPFENQAQQFRWALDNIPIETDWVMRLDADEVIEDDLSAEIVRKLPDLPREITGVNLKRKHYFMGRWVRYGGRYPVVLLRLWRKGAAHVEQRWMDEHMLLDHGVATTFSGNFADINLRDLTFFTDKHNQYATREAIQVLVKKYRLLNYEQEGDLSSMSAKLKRFLKEKLYNKLPFQLSAGGYFLFRYVVQLGFLDSREGRIYHILQGFWYRYLVGAKLVELERIVAGKSRDEARRVVSEFTGISLKG